MTSLHQFLFKKTAPSVRPDQSVVSVWYVNEVGRVVARSSAAEGRQRRAGSNDNSPLGSYSTSIDASKERRPSARSSHDIDNNHPRTGRHTVPNSACLIHGLYALL